MSASAVRRGRDDKKWDRKAIEELKVTTMNVVPCQEVEEVPTSRRVQCTCSHLGRELEKITEPLCVHQQGHFESVLILLQLPRTSCDRDHP